MKNSSFVVAALVLVAPVAALAQASFTGIGTLPGGNLSIVHGMSGDGRVVVGDGSVSSTNIRAFRWTRETGMVNLGVAPGGDLSSGWAASFDGSAVVGHADTGGNLEPFRWTQADGIVPLAELSGSPHIQGFAMGVSADGSVVAGTYTPAQTASAYRWTAVGGFTTLPNSASGAHPIHAAGISADGSVITGETIDNIGYRWTAGGGTTLLHDASAPFRAQSPFAVSADGSTIVGRGVMSGQTSSRAFRWTEDQGVVVLSDLPSGAWDASADGRVISGNVQSRAVIFRDAETIDIHTLLTNLGLDLTGWELTNALCISDDASVVSGSGRLNGQSQGWLAVIPAPGAVAPLLMTLVLSARRRRSNEQGTPINAHDEALRIVALPPSHS